MPSTPRPSTPTLTATPSSGIPLEEKGAAVTSHTSLHAGDAPRRGSHHFVPGDRALSRSLIVGLPALATGRTLTAHRLGPAARPGGAVASPRMPQQPLAVS